MIIHTRLKKMLLFITIVVLVVLSATLLWPADTKAVPSSNFSAGRIIDDPVFFAGADMTVEQMQAFLSSRVTACDTNGTLPYGSTGMTRAEWATANGKPLPPYTCLKSYAGDLATWNPNNYCDGVHGGFGLTVAQIIYRVSYACDVSSRVLIVLLQKEQGLVTDDWPWPRQYQFATGYCVPDGPPPP